MSGAAPHDLSQDSGVASGASPALLQGVAQAGFYDNCRVVVVDPPPSESPAPSLQSASAKVVDLRRGRRASGGAADSASERESGRWKIGNFFRRKGSSKERPREQRQESEVEHFRELTVKDAEENAPPLPPRRQAPVLQQHQVAQRSSSLQMHSPTVPSLSPFSNYDNGLYFCTDAAQDNNNFESTASYSLRSSNSYNSPAQRMSWKEQKEDVMQRVEAKRNSMRDSSDEEEDDNLNADEVSSQCSSVTRGSAPFGGQRRRWRRSREIVPQNSQQAQMDVLARMSQIENGDRVPPLPISAASPAYTSTPPPPPPRDPRRRLYLVKNEEGRPVSYSFEQLEPSLVSSPVMSMTSSQEPSDLGVPFVPRQLRQCIAQSPLSYQQQDGPCSFQHGFQPIPSNTHPYPADGLLRSHHLSASDQHLPAGFVGHPQSSSSSHHHPSQHPYHIPPRQHPYAAPPSNTLDEIPRSRRPVRLNASLPPSSHGQQQQHLQRRSHYTSQPSLRGGFEPAGAPAPLASAPDDAPAQGEYWKAPPPFGVIPLHRYDRARLAFSDDNSRDCSPQRPLRRKTSAGSNASNNGGSNINRHHAASRDSVISPHSHGTATSCSSIEKSGKSSPSSSVSSKDSGCSEPSRQQQQQQRPLATLIEKSESVDRMADRIEETPPPKEHSPVRSHAGDPGFSTKQRRTKFREAMSELEDVLSGIQKDQDLLDRAERRDLPTEHQELIAQARERFQGGASEDTSRHDGEEEDDSAPENAFSDLDAFMNWNTSSSFENIDAALHASSPSSGRRSRQMLLQQHQRRARTPSNRRSGRYDKKTDDMVYRLCRSNNRPQPETINPIAKVDHSYLLRSPVLSPAPFALARDDSGSALDLNSNAVAAEDDDEPDVLADDVSFRQFRDANAGNISDPQPKFGIPKAPNQAAPRSDRDYLHARPEGKRYRSTFNAMRNPDLVLDDMAFRNLRRDSSLDDPHGLGNRPLKKEEDVPSAIAHQRRAEEEEEEKKKSKLPSKEPFVFYPNKHNAVMKTLSEHIAQLIRKQAGSPRGGKEESIVTYDDLKDPKVYEAMRYTLNIAGAEEMERSRRRERDQEDPEWSGKNVFQLLSANIEELLDKKRKEKSPPKGSDIPVPTLSQSEVQKDKEEEEKSPAAAAASEEDEKKLSGDEMGRKEEKEKGQEEDDGKVENEIIIAQHCILEHDLDEFNARLSRHLRRMGQDDKVDDEEGKKERKTLTRLAEMVENHRTSVLEKTRSDSEARDEEEDKDEEELGVGVGAIIESKEAKEGKTKTLGAVAKASTSATSDTTPTSTSSVSAKQRRKGEESSSGNKGSSTSSTKSTGEMPVVCLPSETRGALLDWVPGGVSRRPQLLLAACYALACLYQASGLDFLTALGILIAALSMISIYFI